MAINYFGENRMKQLLALIKGQLDLKATPADIAQAIESANLSQYALASDLTAALTRISTNESDINTIQETLKNVATTEGLSALTNDVNTIKNDYLKAADKTALESKITEAVKAHDESDKAHAALFTAFAGRVTGVEGDIATLNADENTAGSVRKQVADAVAKIVADAPEAYDTLKEISDWISNHTGDAATMNSQINTNQSDIAALKALVGELPAGATSSTVVAYIQEVVNGLSIGDYAKAADLTAAIARIATLEGKAHEHANKSVLDGITQAMVDAWNTSDAEYTEAEVTAMWNSVFNAEA